MRDCIVRIPVYLREASGKPRGPVSGPQEQLEPGPSKLSVLVPLIFSFVSTKLATPFVGSCAK